VEDTAFYRYNRLVSLNEVGGAPDRFGVSVEEFHRECRTRLERWPAALSATSTHDTKRSEDARARIHVLSELSREWRAAVSRWHRWNRRHLVEVDGRPAPDRNDEYLLYQTLVGAWPLGAPGAAEGAGIVERIQAYMLKATREAKVHTSWVSPNEAYEAAVRTFVEAILEPGRRNRFLADFAAFQRPIARLGMLGSLAQTLLKITAPGVPDFYRGTEVWDLSLVDPDNRRPVDFAPRRTALGGLRARAAAGDLPVLCGELLAGWEDGRVKLYVIHRALTYRRAAPDLFERGEYVPLLATGSAAEHVCAFARRLGSRVVLAVVTRLVARLTGSGSRLPLGRETWGDTALLLPSDLPTGSLADAFTGQIVRPVATPSGPALSVAGLLSAFPLALLDTGVAP
jgi:(1->4)-alpha-D-glucan 1-alpha-D-glucosylmutase